MHADHLGYHRHRSPGLAADVYALVPLNEGDLASRIAVQTEPSALELALVRAALAGHLDQPPERHIPHV